jgi:UDP-N-acetylglucosamine 4-epimerase
MNHLAATTQNKFAIGEVFNTAVGDSITLLELTQLLKKYLAKYDSKVVDVEIIHGPNRQGDIPHSLASIDKAKKFLGYLPSHKINQGLEETVKWFSKI